MTLMQYACYHDIVGIYFFYKVMASFRLFSNTFNQTIFYNQLRWKMSTHWDSNPHTLEHKSPPITTRTGALRYEDTFDSV